MSWKIIVWVDYVAPPTANHRPIQEWWMGMSPSWELDIFAPVNNCCVLAAIVLLLLMCHWIGAHIYRCSFDWTAYKSKQSAWLTNNQFNEKQENLSTAVGYDKTYAKTIIYSMLLTGHFSSVLTFATPTLKLIRPRHINRFPDIYIYVFFITAKNWNLSHWPMREKKIHENERMNAKNFYFLSSTTPQNEPLDWSIKEYNGKAKE